MSQSTPTEQMTHHSFDPQRFVNIRRFVRETVAAPYFRRHPVEIWNYGYSKWVFHRNRVGGAEQLLAGVGLADPSAFEGWERYSESIMGLDKKAGIGYEHRKFLYGATRALRPLHVIETGVASGVSTSCILAALIENGRGSLWSVDLPPEDGGGHRHPDGGIYDYRGSGVGSAIPEILRRAMEGRFSLVLEDVRTALPRMLDELPGPLDIFFHDDLHTPDHMLWEYELVWPKLRASGLLISDDINHAWLRWVEKVAGRRQAVINLGRFGAVRKP